MLISQLINKLESAKRKHGDIQVARYIEDEEQGDCHELIKNIKLIKTDRYQFEDFALPYICLK